MEISMYVYSYTKLSNNHDIKLFYFILSFHGLNVGKFL